LVPTGTGGKIPGMAADAITPSLRLTVAPAREPAQARSRHGVEGVAVLWGDAVSHADVQVLHLVAKVTDIIGLYLGPPENAIVLCGREVPDPGAGPDPQDAADAGAC